jgi:hypothetical protein
MDTGIEKRRHPRIPLKWPVTLMTPQGPIMGVTNNISVSGALIFYSETIETEGEFQITLKSSGEYELPITCKKVWSDKMVADNSEYNAVGLVFAKISSSIQNFIASLIAEYSLA